MHSASVGVHNGGKEKDRERERERENPFG